MLLTEHIPFTVDKKIIEESINSNKPLVVTGVIQRAEAKNQNGRVYPREVLVREAKKYHKEFIKQSRAMGELFESYTAIDIIKWKEVYGQLEGATDRCEEIASILEGIVIKHA